MEKIPDAPWIRKAEREGFGEKEVRCPCCEEVCTVIYKDQFKNAFGCNKCVETQDSLEWQEEEAFLWMPER